MPNEASLIGRFWAVGVAVVVTITGFLAVFPFGFVLGTVLDLLGVDLSLVEAAIIGVLLLQGVAFPLTAFGYLRLRGSSFSFVKLRIPTVRDGLWMVSGYVLVLVLAISLLILVTLVGAPTASRANQEVFQNTQAILWFIPLSLLVIAPGEELLFRGIIQGRLRESFGPVGAIVLASATFAPAHILALTGSLQALAVTISILFVPALVFGIAYEASDNLLVPAVIHGAYNATIFGFVYLGLRYGGTQPPGLLSVAGTVTL